MGPAGHTGSPDTLIALGGSLGFCPPAGDLPQPPLDTSRPGSLPEPAASCLTLAASGASSPLSPLSFLMCPWAFAPPVPGGAGPTLPALGFLPALMVSPVLQIPMGICLKPTSVVNTCIATGQTHRTEMFS